MASAAGESSKMATSVGDNTAPKDANAASLPGETQRPCRAPFPLRGGRWLVSVGCVVMLSYKAVQGRDCPLRSLRCAALPQD